MMLRRILNAIPFLALLSLTSLLGAPNAAGATHDVDIQGFAFNPKILPIQVGDTVRWTNLDAVFHTATSDAGVWDSGTLMQGDSFSFKFNMPGDYVYHCSFHPLTMKDAHIIVQGSLGIDADQIPETAGGTVHFFLDAGTANGNRNCLLLGSISGTVPGTPLPGGPPCFP